MANEAQRSRAPIQRLADTVPSYFVPAGVGVAVVTFVAWAGWGPEPRMAYAIVNAGAALIIACPCALGLATPMSITVDGRHRAGGHGGRAHPQRRGARGDGEGRHAGRRQDGHAHRGQAEARDHRAARLGLVPPSAGHRANGGRLAPGRDSPWNVR